MNAYKHGGCCFEVKKMQQAFTQWKRELNRMQAYLIKEARTIEYSS